jgi:hypothetical protein
MAFDVYPGAPTFAPLLVNDTLVLNPITREQFGSGTVEGLPWPSVMRIYVASLDHVTPKLFLRVTSAAGAGPSTQVPVGFSTTAIDDGGPSGGTDYGDANLQTLPSNPNVYVLQVVLNQVGSTGDPKVDGATWELGIQCPTGTSGRFTWVVADSDTDAQQGWLHLPASLDFNTAIGKPLLVGRSYPATLRVDNFGTGPLTINIPGTALGAFTPTATPAGGLTVQAASSTTGATDPTITFLPVASGTAVPQTLTVSGRTVALTGKAGFLEVVLLLDASGSMSWVPGGDTPGGATGSRWYQLGQAVSSFLGTLSNFAASGKYGIALFQGGAPVPPLVGANNAPATIPTTKDAVAIGKVQDSTRPGGGTPIGLGLDTAMGATTVANDYGLFSNAPNDVANDHRWLVLMSDGKQNTAHDPTTDPTDFQKKKVNVITVAYGQGGTDVDKTLLSKIATAGKDALGGVPYAFDAGPEDLGNTPVNPDPTGGTSNVDLFTAFVKVINRSLGLPSSADPGGALTISTPSAKHPILVSSYDSRVEIAAHWATPELGRGLSVTLITPLGETVTPSTAGAMGIKLDSDGLFASYFIDEPALLNKADPAHPRHGTWTLVLDYHRVVINVAVAQLEAKAAHAGVAPDSVLVRYGYHSLNDSHLGFALSTKAGAHHAGDTINLVARLSLAGQPLPNAAVTVSVASPADSPLNWLARTPVTQAEYDAAAQALSGSPDLHALLIKGSALEAKGLTFPRQSGGSTLTMTFDPADGLYKATVPQTSVQGIYHFFATAIGQDPEGNIFRREERVQLDVEVLPDPRWSLWNLGYVKVGNQIHVTATVGPRDRFGNVVLIDPAFDKDIQFTIAGGALAGPLKGNLDGTYTQELTYPAGSVATIGVTVRGQGLVTGGVLPDFGTMIFVNEVVGFHAGREATPGANQHTNPSLALGDPTAKPPTQFVSLGGHGSGTFAVKGEIVHAREVTVFVAPDPPPRPYLVEVLFSGWGADWVTVGRSTGTTQTFSVVPRLRHADETKDSFVEIEGSIAGSTFDVVVDLDSPLREAKEWLDRLTHRGIKAIRVVDKSGRIYDLGHTPSHTPGVSIQGIGFTR